MSIINLHPDGPVGLLTTGEWENTYGKEDTGPRRAGPAPLPYPVSFRPSDYSDAGNAAVFVDKNREKLIFTDSMGWLYWNGKHWERNEHKALELAETFSEYMLEEAKTLDRRAKHELADLDADAAEGKKNEDAIEKAKKDATAASNYLKHAMLTRRAARIRAVLDLARPYLVLPGNAMDANPIELNTQSGIVNLITGEQRPHSHNARCSKITAAACGTRGSDIWQDFLDTVTCRDNSLNGFLQMVIGMALFGTIYHEGFAFAIGDGANGKSTFFNSVAAVFGDYAGYIDIDVILVRSGNTQAELATLRGKRLVIAGELGQGRHLSESTIKKITSKDPITVTEKYKHPETIMPSHTLCVFANNFPHVKALDDGTWRRIIVIPFNAKIQGKNDIKNYSEYLVKNAGEAILSWAIEGAIRYARNGFHLDMPDAVAEATSNYHEQENWLINFINERCIREPNARVGARELYTAYMTWSEGLGERAVNEKDFAIAMKRAEFKSLVPKGIKCYLGLRLVSEYDHENHWDTDMLPL